MQTGCWKVRNFPQSLWCFSIKNDKVVLDSAVWLLETAEFFYVIEKILLH